MPGDLGAVKLEPFCKTSLRDDQVADMMSTLSRLVPPSRWDFAFGEDARQRRPSLHSLSVHVRTDAWQQVMFDLDTLRTFAATVIGCAPFQVTPDRIIRFYGEDLSRRRRLREALAPLVPPSAAPGARQALESLTGAALRGELVVLTAAPPRQVCTQELEREGVFVGMDFGFELASSLGAAAARHCDDLVVQAAGAEGARREPQRLADRVDELRCRRTLDRGMAALSLLRGRTPEGTVDDELLAVVSEALVAAGADAARVTPQDLDAIRFGRGVLEEIEQARLKLEELARPPERVVCTSAVMRRIAREAGALETETLVHLCGVPVHVDERTPAPGWKFLPQPPAYFDSLKTRIEQDLVVPLTERVVSCITGPDPLASRAGVTVVAVDEAASLPLPREDGPGLAARTDLPVMPRRHYPTGRR